NYPTIQQAFLQTQQQQALTGTAKVLEPFNISTSGGQINSNVFDYNIGAAQGFKLPNAYKAEQKLLQQNVTVAQSYQAVTKSELVRNVSNTYYNWLNSYQQYRLLLQTDSLFADYEKFANKKYEVGESNKLEKINGTLQRKELQLQL
ncbi:TolC family protein, partial [Priestia megaterium]|uniref:TolC family protein n=1 Tax=Priestia megaterium TaxID=1404 RepID=UPI002041F794